MAQKRERRAPPRRREPAALKVLREGLCDYFWCACRRIDVRGPTCAGGVRELGVVTVAEKLAAAMLESQPSPTGVEVKLF